MSSSKWRIHWGFFFVLFCFDLRPFYFGDLGAALEGLTALLCKVQWWTSGLAPPGSLGELQSRRPTDSEFAFWQSPQGVHGHITVREELLRKDEVCLCSVVVSACRHLSLLGSPGSTHIRKWRVNLHLLPMIFISWFWIHSWFKMRNQGILGDIEISVGWVHMKWNLKTHDLEKSWNIFEDNKNSKHIFGLHMVKTLNKYFWLRALGCSSRPMLADWAANGLSRGFAWFTGSLGGLESQRQSPSQPAEVVCGALPFGQGSEAAAHSRTPLLLNAAFSSVFPEASLFPEGALGDL